MRPDWCIYFLTSPLRQYAATLPRNHTPSRRSTTTFSVVAQRILPSAAVTARQHSHLERGAIPPHILHRCKYPSPSVLSQTTGVLAGAVAARAIFLTETALLIIDTQVSNGSESRRHMDLMVRSTPDCLSSTTGLVYRGSARTLHAFVQSHDITCFLGAHIEMRRSPRGLFPLGTIFQPDEHPLQLRRADLLQWATLCDRLGDDGVGQHASGSFVIDIQ